MCTISIIPLLTPAGAPGFRLVTNRDESRVRAPALPPCWHGLASGDAAIYPVDPTGGGTWVGASRQGLVLCLLNANPLPAPRLPPRDDLVSRGTIIPQLIDRPAIDTVMGDLGALELGRYAPFRLVAVRPDAGAGFVAVEATWDRSRLVIHKHPRGLVCLVSSGLGDPLVKPRLALFDEMIAAPSRESGEPVTPAQQDRFHHHTWPDRPEISVLMTRAEARTVSITNVEVALAPGAGLPHVSMTYEKIPEVVVPAQSSGAARALRALRPL